MPGLIGLGQAYRQQAEAGLSKASELETIRKAENQQKEAARQTQQASLTGTGAALGYAAGAAGAEAGSAAGPWGAVIGAAVGFLAGEFL